MSKIKDLFDPSKDIYRSIEKVVTFGSLKPESLKKEISEYVVTEKLRYNFEKILDTMDAGMESDSHEIGIWVSGFYGSGKSSFAKYFGLGLKKGFIIDGISFQERLGNRINSQKITQQLKTLIQKYDPEIFLIDLATQQISGHTLAPVGTIIYHEVMKWAGYASEEKIALLERKLEMDGKLDEFKHLIKTEKDEDWDTLKFEDKLTAKGIAQEYAPKFYPKIWKDDRSFNITKVDDIENDKEKISEMLTLIRKKSGKENVLFIIDEVGQYVAADNALILQLQGTLENLKDIGNGKAWLLATAQQTLTEDNPNARFNSDKLYKLNDRFPIKIDIEASDIKEITTQRLLGKSTLGGNTLKQIFKEKGEMLRINARLNNVDRTIYKEEIDEKNFIDLYPFLPFHFNLLLSLLARLAKKTGGIGLRSAIRVIQDVLTENSGDMLAEGEIGTLATTAHIYNVLKSDIRKSYPHVSASVDKVVQIFDENSEESKIAKSIATLQILDDFYLSVENLSVMMHPSVDAPSQTDKVRNIVNELKNTRGLTLKEIDGQLRFMTDAIIKIEEEKQKIYVSSADTKRVFENQIEDIFTPVPTARISNTKSVKSGIQLILEDRLYKLLEPNEEIQYEIHFALRERYERTLEELRSKSTEKTNENKLFILGTIETDLDKTLEEIVRCEGIAGTKNRYDDKEINDYLTSQFQESQDLKQKLRRKLISSLENGEFLFRGSSKPSSALGSQLRDATNIWLKSCAEKVYHKYEQAPQSMESTAAQKLLQIDDLRAVPPALNPFNIIKGNGSVDVNAASLRSIEDYLQQEGQVDGRKFLEHFNEAPFGWHKDTTRYLVTIMFLASVVKLRISGDTVTVKGPSAIEKLSNGQAFHPIGISLYSDDQPTNEQKLKAANNLTELTKNTILPLPQKISEAVMKHFPVFQTRYATLKMQLENLSLSGIEKAASISEGIEEILKGDASDATFRLGKEDAELYLNLKWAANVHEAFNNKIDVLIKNIRSTQNEVETLPNEGLIGEFKLQLKSGFTEIEQMLQSESFYEKAADLKDKFAEMENSINDFCEKFRKNENSKITKDIASLKYSENWPNLTPEQKQEFLSRLENSFIGEKTGMKGIREIITEAYSFTSLIRTIEVEIEELIKESSISGSEEESKPIGKPIKKVVMTHLPKRIEKKEELDTIIDEFTLLRNAFNGNEVIDISW